MKKIPTIFERVYDGHSIVGLYRDIVPGFEWVLTGEGEATVKFDGSCCAFANGKFYKRFDAKPGREIPDGAIPCCPPDSVTGHWPHWVEVRSGDPADVWFLRARDNNLDVPSPSDRFITYEAVGQHFNGNPYGMDDDILIRHGSVKCSHLVRSFDGICEYLRCSDVEGIVFWKDGEPRGKIKRTDFGFPWPSPYWCDRDG